MAAKVNVRAATDDDVDAVVQLVHSAYRGDSSRAGWTTEADLLDGLRTNADEVTSLVPHLLVAEHEGELVGCCTVVPKDDHAYFGLFAVRPGLQAGGIGSVLLAAAEDRARGLGFASMEMTVLALRTELIAFYVRRGYVATGQSVPFPYGDTRYGLPRVEGLTLDVYTKEL